MICDNQSQCFITLIAQQSNFSILKFSDQRTSTIAIEEKYTNRVVMVVKQSACSPSTPTIRVRIMLQSTIFSVKLWLKRTKINKKEAGLLKQIDSFITSLNKKGIASSETSEERERERDRTFKDIFVKQRSHKLIEGRKEVGASDFTFKN